MNKSENKWRSKKFTQKYFLPLIRPKTYAIIPFLNKNVALRSETHRAIWFWAFCAFRGKSRGRDAPPTATLQILMRDLLSELVLLVC